MKRRACRERKTLPLPHRSEGKFCFSSCLCRVLHQKHTLTDKSGIRGCCHKQASAPDWLVWLWKRKAKKFMSPLELQNLLCKTLLSGFILAHVKGGKTHFRMHSTSGIMTSRVESDATAVCMCVVLLLLVTCLCSCPWILILNIIVIYRENKT